MTTEEKFNEFYQTIVTENADNMEKIRKEVQKQNRINNRIAIIIILIIAAISYGFYKRTGNFEKTMYVLGISAFIGGVVGSILGRKNNIEYTKKFKTKIIGEMIRSFEEQLKFIPQSRTILPIF